MGHVSGTPVFPFGFFAKAAVFETGDRILRIQGDDARSWLSGQVTNDLKDLEQKQAVYVLAVNVKGRILSDGWACLRQGQLFLVLPEERAQLALESFDKHIIMEDVELALDDQLRVLTIQGPDAASVLEAAKLADQAYPAARIAGTGFDVWVSSTELEHLKVRLENAAQALGGGSVDAATWAQAHVLSGVPRCGVDFGEDTYPQEAGLKSRAVSFSKGCYLGQEVICMLENRGQLARRLVQLETPGSISLEPRTHVFDQEHKRVGELTSSSVTPAETGTTFATKTLALAYLKRAMAEPGKLVRAGDHEWVVRTVVGSETSECPIVAR